MELRTTTGSETRQNSGVQSKLERFNCISSTNTKGLRGVNIWLMCLQDSEINLMESKMVGISTMIGGFVPGCFGRLC